MLYAHGGLTAEDSAIQKVADLRPTLLEAGVHPICFIWRTDLWTTIGNILQDSITHRRPEGFLDNVERLHARSARRRPRAGREERWR